MARRLVTLLLIGVMLSMCGSALAQEGKTPDELLNERYDKPVTITTVLGYKESEDSETPDDLTPAEDTLVKAVKDELNINLEYLWIVNNSQYDAKFGAELAAGSLPDVMWLSAAQFQDLYEQGGLLDLTEVWDTYANDELQRVFNPEGIGIKAGMRDGKIYGLPSHGFTGQGTSQMYYDMNKLKAYGIENYSDLPKTISEFEALCDKLLADSGGLPVLPANKLYIDQGLADFSPFFHAYQAWINGWVDFTGTGVLEYAGIQPNVKKALTKLNEWYGKGYFAKDFAAIDVWAADTPVVADIVAGKYAIVPGSWWVTNWPLNTMKENDPAADWVCGPTLVEDGGSTKVMLDRYRISTYVAISANCKNPEAVLKMINWEIQYQSYTNSQEYKDNETDEQKLARHSHVYIWMPWRVFDSTVLPTNYAFVDSVRKAGYTSIDDIDPDTIPKNNEIIPWLNTYFDYVNGVKMDDPVAWANTWGFYMSRMAPDGGNGVALDLYHNADRYYNELSATTPTMITKQGMLNEYRDQKILQMIMGEMPLDQFDTYIAEWKRLGGDEIAVEVNDWFAAQQ